MLDRRKKANESGQSLMELVIVLAVAITVISALTAVSISSLRNANLSQMQLQATKYAQEGIERVRSARDRDTETSAPFSTANSTPIEKFSHLYATTIYSVCPDPCNFLLNGNQLSQTSNFENLGGNFQRKIFISDDSSSWQDKKIVRVVVSWTDFAGVHESQLNTILRKI